MRRLVAGVAAIFLAVVTAPVASAAKPPAPPPAPAPTGTIHASDMNYLGEGTVAVRAATGGFVPTCGGDPSHGTPRRFVDIADGTVVVRGESCAAVETFTDEHRRAVIAKWSFDDTAVAFLAYDATVLPEERTYSLYVSPAGALVDARRVAVLPNGGTFDWSPFGDRLVIAQPNPDHKRSQSDPDGFAPPDLYVVGMDGTLVNVTNTPEPEHGAVWSPDGATLAFFRQTVFKGNVRTDLFTMPVTGGAQRQVTNKANATAGVNRYPVWSPDGAHLGFSCAPFSGGSHVCRIDAAGTSKAVDLTPRSDANFVTRAWR